MGAADLQAGQVLGGTYRILRLVGEGGMGSVYEATHARLAGRYAVKLIRREFAGNEQLFARFRREAEVTSALRHPNIVQVFDFSADEDGTPYIVMEFLEGADLSAALAPRAPLPLRRVVDIVDQVASGLAAAHEQGIVHRDLKPANVYLVPLPGRGRELAKVVDFGISKVKSASIQLTRTATVIGTPQYMAPEQALGQGERIGPAADQFSLAVMTWEMLAGHPPFDADTVAGLVYQIVHEPAPALPLGGAVAAVLDRALAKRPEDRFAGVLEFAQALARAADGASDPVPQAVLPTVIAAPPLAATRLSDPGASAAITERMPGRRRWVPLVGAAAAVLVAAGIWAVRRRDPEPPRPAVRVEPAPPSSPAPPAPVPPSLPRTVTVELTDAPEGLRVIVDGVASSLPLRWPRDGRTRVVRLEAPGRVAREERITADRDLVIDARLPAAAADPRRRSKPTPERPAARRPRPLLDL